MSQSAELTLVIASVEALRDAISELGAIWSKQKALTTEDGRNHAVDYVVTDTDGTSVGVRVDPRTQRAVLVSDGCGSRAQALGQRIAQRYAYSRISEELRRKGYRISDEARGQDGSIRLVATRWS